jgi:hypothetical protein
MERCSRRIAPTKCVEAQPLNQVITGDSNSELGYAIGKASQQAASSGKIIFVYSSTGLLWMTDQIPPDGCERVAKCWPGGRKELKRIVATNA